MSVLDKVHPRLGKGKQGAEGEHDRLTYVLDTITSVSERVDVICQSLNQTAKPSVFKADDYRHSQTQIGSTLEAESELEEEAPQAIGTRQREQSIVHMKPKYIDEEMVNLAEKLRIEISKMDDKRRIIFDSFLKHYKIMVEFEKNLRLDREKVLEDLYNSIRALMPAQEHALVSETPPETIHASQVRRGVSKHVIAGKIGNKHLAESGSRQHLNQRLDDIPLNDLELYHRIQGNIRRLSEFLRLQKDLAYANNLIQYLEEGSGETDEEEDDKGEVNMLHTKRRSLQMRSEFEAYTELLESEKFASMSQENKKKTLTKCRTAVASARKVFANYQVLLDNATKLRSEKKNFMSVMQSSVNSHPATVKKKQIEAMISHLKKERLKWYLNISSMLASLCSTMDKTCNQLPEARNADVAAITRYVPMMDSIADEVESAAERLSFSGFDKYGNIEQSQVNTISMLENPNEDFLLERMTGFWNDLMALKSTVTSDIREVKGKVKESTVPYNDLSSRIKLMLKPPNDEAEIKNFTALCVSTACTVAADFSKAMVQKLNSLLTLRLCDQVLVEPQDQMRKYRFNLMFRVTVDEVKESPSGAKITRAFGERNNNKRLNWAGDISSLDTSRSESARSRSLASRSITGPFTSPRKIVGDFSNSHLSITASFVNESEVNGEQDDLSEGDDVIRDIIHESTSYASTSISTIGPRAWNSSASKHGTEEAHTQIRLSMTRLRRRRLRDFNSPKACGDTVFVPMRKPSLPPLQPRSSTAKYFRFHATRAKPSIPRKFIFYTKGVGVFADKNGKLVDAEGFPFPKTRKIPGRGCELRQMYSDLQARRLEELNPQELRLALGDKVKLR